MWWRHLLGVGYGDWWIHLHIYSRPHKLFGHSRVFILTIIIYVKRIIFSNDCISKRLKDRKLKLFHNIHQTMHDKTNIYTIYGLPCK